jgi:hypothetical protein
VRDLSDAELQRLEILAVVTEVIGLNSNEPGRWVDELSEKLPGLRERLEVLRQQDAGQFTVTEPAAPRWGANIGSMPQESQLNWSVPVGNPAFEKEFIMRVTEGGAQVVSDWLPEWLATKGGDDLLNSAWAVHEFLGKMDAEIRRVPRYLVRGDYRDAAPIYHAIAAKVFARLNAELGDPMDARGNGPLREATLRYALMAFSGTEQTVDDALKKRLVAIAKLDLATMRAACAEGHTAEGYSQFSKRMQHFHACCEALCSFGSLAEILPQVLLLLRALSVPGVAADLNYWEADALTFPSGKFGNFFQFIPGALIGAVHNCGANEATSDPELIEARGKLADFCLGRLGQRKGTPRPDSTNHAELETLIERSNEWRLCYVRAAECLRINPRGRGHHVLNWTASHDPDSAVRAAAKEACATLRRQPTLKVGTSPRRPLITALWWLFQAHRLNLGEAIDPIGIQATLAAFLRRTTERESSANLRLGLPDWAWAGPPRFEPL